MLSDILSILNVIIILAKKNVYLMIIYSAVDCDEQDEFADF